jgi:dephospho-CoA kinase
MKGFDAVIAVIGYKAAGKDTLCEYLVSKHGFVMERTSDHIREEAKKRGISAPTTKDLQDVGDSLRKESTDPGCWMRRMIEHAGSVKAKKVLMNGIRNPAEIPVLQELAGEALILVGVVATTVVRAKRFMAKFPKDAPTLDYFLLMDDRDRGVGQPSYGQQVDRTLALVPYENVCMNTSTPEAMHAWTETFLVKHKVK